MPHYRDGTEAKVGDFVVGKSYNTDRVIAGTLISITRDAESCNCQVQFTEAQPCSDQDLPGRIPWPKMSRFDASGRAVAREVHGEAHGSTGLRFWLVECVDYGAVKDFVPVRPEMAIAPNESECPHRLLPEQG